MKAHMNIVHTKRKTDKVDANALLGFGAAKEEEDSGFRGKKRYEQNQKVELKDNEGVDFGYYFST